MQIGKPRPDCRRVAGESPSRARVGIRESANTRLGTSPRQRARVAPDSRNHEGRHQSAPFHFASEPCRMTRGDSGWSTESDILWVGIGRKNSHRVQLGENSPHFGVIVLKALFQVFVLEFPGVFGKVGRIIKIRAMSGFRLVVRLSDEIYSLPQRSLAQGVARVVRVTGELGLSGNLLHNGIRQPNCPENPLGHRRDGGVAAGSSELGVGAAWAGFRDLFPAAGFRNSSSIQGRCHTGDRRRETELARRVRTFGTGWGRKSVFGFGPVRIGSLAVGTSTGPSVESSYVECPGTLGYANE